LFNLRDDKTNGNKQYILAMYLLLSFIGRDKNNPITKEEALFRNLAK
jgi:hypothetical protein